ncbi:MAG: prenyltransferase [Candidatus Omnitrophica bacterium]|nr:prenyltransferase [Candidatus Omnitrophota bacterium]
MGVIEKYVRALRLPFITASILPFIAGSLIDRTDFGFTAFLLGLAAVISTHLGANLINDYADSKTGTDWQDIRPYGLFGGSKLIQEGVFSERFYLRLSLICFSLASICIVTLAALLGSGLAVIFYLLVLFLGFSYSCPPLRLSYRRLGELTVFLLFGPAPVMAGYFLQTGAFPDLMPFMLSLPFGFLTAMILFSNEVPDFQDDLRSGKRTLVGLTGADRAFLLYRVLIAAVFLSIIVNIAFGYLSAYALLSFAFIPVFLKAGGILKCYYNDKNKLVESSRITIMAHTFLSIALILDLIL